MQTAEFSEEMDKLFSWLDDIVALHSFVCLFVVGLRRSVCRPQSSLRRWTNSSPG